MATLRGFVFCMVFGVFSALAHAEGTQIKSFEIKGLDSTRPSVVLRELPFAEGEFWQESMAAEAERRLRNLGLFSTVLVKAPDEDGRVEIVVRERWSLWLLPEATRKDNGASSAGASLTEHNFLGLHHNLRLGYRKDTGKNFSGGGGESYSASYLWRRVNESRLDLEVNGGRGTTIADVFQNNISIAQFEQQSSSWGILGRYYLGATPGEGWSGRLGMTVSQTKSRKLFGPGNITLKDERRHAVQIGTSYAWKNDHLTWGTGEGFDYLFDIAHKSLGSTYRVYRHSISWYRHVEVGTEKTLGMRLVGGYVGGEYQLDGLFDIGNRNEFRGYYPGEIQGTAYTYGSLEYRMLLEPGGNLQWVAYADVGHMKADGLTTLDPLLIGTGTGIRWTLRWLVEGTLRADVAYGWATKRMRFYLGTGQAF